MDVGFTAFVLLVAILVAVGGSLLLVGQVGTPPRLVRLRLPELGADAVRSSARADGVRVAPLAGFLPPGKQVFAGLALILLAVLILYKGGT
jgi:hypothetical protein